MNLQERSLEVGSGSNPRNNNSEGQKVAIDINSSSLKVLQKSGWSVAVADAQNLPFKNDSFDRVDCHHVLEHLPDSKKALDEITRVMKPEAHLEISVPHPFFDTIMAVSLAGYYPYWSPKNHQRVFTVSGLKEQISKAKLKIESLREKGWWRAATTIQTYVSARLNGEPMEGHAVRIQSKRMSDLLKKKQEYFENVKVFDRAIPILNKFLPYEIRVSAKKEPAT